MVDEYKLPDTIRTTWSGFVSDHWLSAGFCLMLVVGLIVLYRRLSR